MRIIALGLFLALAPQLASADQKQCKNTFKNYDKNRFYDVMDYGDFKVSDVTNAVRTEIRLKQRKVREIKENPETPTFENTILALENPINKMQGIPKAYLETMALSNSSKETQAAGKILSKLESNFNIELATDKVLFERVKSVYEQRDQFKLSEADKLLLESTYNFFKNSGIELNESQQARLKELNERITELKKKFAAVRLNYAKNVYLVFTKEQLAGVPEAELAKLKTNNEGALWEFEKSLEALASHKTNRIKNFREFENAVARANKRPEPQDTRSFKNSDFPLHNSIIDAKSFEASYKRLREKYENDKGPGYRVYGNMGEVAIILNFAKDPNVRRSVLEMTNKEGQTLAYDNRQTLIELVNAKREKDQILGFKSTAHQSLSTKMEKSPEKIVEFINKLRDAALPKAKEEIEELTRYAQSKGYKENRLNEWDVIYYQNLFKKENFSIDEAKIKEYFELDNVVKEMLALTEQLYGVELVFRPDVKGFHKDSFTYAMLKDGKPLASITFDMYSRTNKKAGAWMIDMAHSWMEGDMRVLPAASVNMNIMKPKEGKTLLSFDQVVTLFHEMGHAIHGTIGTTKYKSQFGVNTPWDFVETPSQFYELFVTVPEVLAKLAKHYKTGEALNDKEINNLLAAKKFMGAVAMIRQLSLSKIDFSYHYRSAELDKNLDLVKFESEATKDLQFYGPLSFSMGPKFSHIMSGGYTAGYHSYKWAEVMSTDIGSLVIKNGKINYEMNKKWHDMILSKGSSVELQKAVEDFLGRELDIKPLLRHNGIIE